jgi:formyl-CoA transferase
VHDISQVAEDEQTEALGIIQSLDHSSVGEFRTVALPLSTDGERARFPSAPPLLGEHTGEVLGELGYSAEDIEGLAAAGVVRVGNGPAR